MAASVGPNLGLTYAYAFGEQNWHSGVEAGLKTLDAVVHASVIDKDLATPPGSPASGDRYLVATGGTGVWAGQDGKLARYNGNSSSWEFFTPKKGWRVWVEDELRVLYHTGSAWKSVFFESAGQTITAAGSLAVPHGLGMTPDSVETWLKCTTAEAGYSINDVIPLPSQDITGNYGCGFTPDATNLNVRFGSAAAVFKVLNKTTGAAANITLANWQAIFRARKS